MNGLNYDPGLRKAIAQQDFERRFAESEKVRLMKIASGEQAVSKDIEGFRIGQILNSVGGLIAQSASSILIALNVKNDTLKA